MKRVFPLILSIIIACLCLAGCGSDGKSADEFDESAFMIDSEYIAALVADYIQSDSYLSAVAEYENQIGKSSGCQLEKAMEYHLYEYEGFKIDAILFQLKSDVVYGEGIIDDKLAVYVDLNTGEVYDSLADDHLERSLNLDGVPDTEEELRSTLMNVLRDFNLNSDEVFFHWKAYKKALGADEIAAVNGLLGLGYKGHGNAANDESSDQQQSWNEAAVIDTDPQERIDKVIELAMVLKESPVYQEASLDASSIRIRAAMEYKHSDFGSGYPVHIIMINADNINTDFYGLESGTLLLDMNNGKTYTAWDFDFNSLVDARFFSSAEDAYPWCVLSYNNILEGSETELWTGEGQTMIALNDDELAQINDFLASNYAEEEKEKDALRYEKAENLTEKQKLLFDAAMEFSKTSHYKERAAVSNRISISHASEWTFAHPDNGFEFNALLLVVDSIDKDMYGFSAGMYLVDLNAGLGYADSFMDLGNWTWDGEDYSDINNVYAYCFAAYEWTLGENEGHMIMDDSCDRVIHFAKEDIDAVNAALNP